MRIEVGYGLEGVLTDALSKVILATAVTPKFKAGDYNAGVESGVDGIIEVLSGDRSEWAKKLPPQPSLFEEMLPLLDLRAVRLHLHHDGAQRRAADLLSALPPRRPADHLPAAGRRLERRRLVGRLLLGRRQRGGGFDDFSGGGGSSGGGGASGDW